MTSAEPLPKVDVQTVSLVREALVHQAGLCFGRPSMVALEKNSAQFLHSDEISHLSSLKFEKRRTSYLAGRYCAKRAICAVHSDLEPASICVAQGVFNQPVVRNTPRNIQVSITHAGDWGGAIAFPEEQPMGIDMEEIRPQQGETIRSQMNPSEMERLPSFARSELEMLTLFWTMKEALSKVIRCGMMTPFSVFEVAAVEKNGEQFSATFVNFAQYKTLSFFIDDHKLAVSLVAPKNTTVQFNIPGKKHG